MLNRKIMMNKRIKMINKEIKIMIKEMKTLKMIMDTKDLRIKKLKVKMIMNKTFNHHLTALKIQQEKLHKSKRENLKKKKKNNRIYLVSKILKLKRIQIHLYKKMSLKIIKILVMKKHLKMCKKKIK